MDAILKKRKLQQKESDSNNPCKNKFLFQRQFTGIDNEQKQDEDNPTNYFNVNRC
jgi:hypothetical protein